MKNAVKNEPVMQFVFQTIKLDQVEKLIPATYRSKYEAIRNQVIDKIKTMAADETFIFQPQDKKTKLDDNLIGRICHGINTGIIRENLNWKISFSNKASAFVVAPYKRYKLGKRSEAKAAAKTLATIPKNVATVKPIKITDDEMKHLKHLLDATHKHFGKTLMDLQIKLNGGQNPELSSVKKAFLYVGRNAMGVKLSHIGKLLGLESSSTTTMCQRALKDPQSREYVKVLTDAIAANGTNGGN